MKTLVIGGGVSGLLAAWHLQNLGQDVEVWEEASIPGGWVQTLPWREGQGDAGRFEKGPQGVLVRAGSPTERLFKALDLKLKSPGKGRRWVGKGQGLIEVPAHPIRLITSPLMRPLTKLRMFMEPLQRVREAEPEEGLSAFMARRAGKGVAEELLPAMVAGILAAPPHVLSVDAIPMLRKWESYGSLLAGIQKSGISHLYVPEGGMGALTQSLCGALKNVRLGVKAHALERLEHGWRVKGEGHVLDVDRVVLAVPAFEAAQLLGPHAPQSAEALAAIPYTSVKLWHSRHALLLPYANAFGFLIDPPSGRPYLGTLVPSWIDAGCAPAGVMQLRSFIGDSKLWEDPAPDAPKNGAWVEGHLKRWLPDLSPAMDSKDIHCENAIPRAEMGHRARVRQAIGRLPEGVDWVSNARFGPGVRDVIEGMEHWLDKPKWEPSQV